MATSGQYGKTVYIYDLPFCERTELCKILNQSDKWEELAGRWMSYDMMTIQNLRKEKNPTDELLTLWSIHNHTVLELFILLSKMQHYRAMILLKSFVDSRFHVLIDRGEGNMKTALAASAKGRIMTRGGVAVDTSKYSKIGAQNFNRITPPHAADLPKIIIDENTGKILNQTDHSHQQQRSIVPSNSNNLLVPSPTPNRVNIASQKFSGLTLGKSEITLPQISYDELTRATDGWNIHKILGKGGFGTVYHGTWKNTDVAIKKIERRGRESDEGYVLQLQQSLREITILNSRPHENILSLYAYSVGGNAPCLVYQFMRNGSVEDRLLLRHNSPPLTWLQRHEIAKGTARGLQYLHTIGDKPLIHGDIKSANILLDKNFEPRIGDFGLAREGPVKDSMKVSKIHGTRPYLPEEFLKDKCLSKKVDTYSYGIVMFELATGLPPYDDSRSQDKFLKDFMDHWNEKNLVLLIDKKAGNFNYEVYFNLIRVGKWCSNRLAQYRPEMVQVFEKLNSV
ncbi:hypothetical protein PV327_004558 [Microctonus hyperodae]|uniref:non-specific serine/threonine protein kinase n=1 Tax=Microctonus hyperodae TaxID=165561 RepID=A0AA39FCZ2_MICHY|nr:hypothetical protein PV327_004558 [Microctonus hyperodae]